MTKHPNNNVVNHDDLQMMTAHANQLAQNLAQALEHIQMLCRYPEPEFDSKGKGEAFLTRMGSWLQNRRQDHELDKSAGTISNEYVRVKRRLQVLDLLTQEQRGLLNIKD